MIRWAILALLLAGCGDARLETSKRVNERLQEEVWQCRIDLENAQKERPADIVHRYEINLTTFKVPPVDGFSVANSAFIYGCGEHELNSLRDFLAANVTKDCPTKVEKTAAQTFGLSVAGEE